MRKFLLFVLVMQTGISSALTKNDVLSVQNGIYYLDGVPFAEIGWNKFDINWLFWEEVYAERSLTDTNEMVIKQRNSIRELAESGVKTIRIFGCVHESKFSNWISYYNNPLKHELCWASLDKTLAICEEYNIRAIVSLKCENFVDRSTTPAENQRELMGDPNSASRVLLYTYLNEVITRYKNRKGVLAWEVGNELTLKPDINPGSRVYDGERKPTLAQLSQFYKDVAQKIKTIDTLRMVTSGGSILRESAYGLSIIPQTDTDTNWPAKRDTYSQHLNAYGSIFNNSEFENVDIHFYMLKAPNYQILADNETTPLIMDEIKYNALSTALGKPLMMGEYGAIPGLRTDRNKWLTGQDWFETFTGESDSAQMYVQQAADRAVESGCRLIYWWCYDSHRPQEQTDPQRFDLDLVRTPILFQKVLDANRRLKLKYNIHNPPKIIYVTPTGSSTADGLSWANAVSLSRGRTLVNEYNTQAVENQIWMKAGTYDITAGFLLTLNITIYGGFAGTETLLSERNWVTNQTIINRTGSSQGQVIYSNVEKDVLLDGLILQGGRPTSTTGCGSITNGTTLRNCIIRNNKAVTNTCGLNISQVSGATKIVVVDNCLIINNEAGASLEAIKIGVAGTEIRNTTIANNMTTQTGASSVITGTVAYKIYNSIIYNNKYNTSTAAISFATNTSKVLTNNAWDFAPADGIMTNTLLLTSSPFVAATSFVGVANGTDKLLSTIESADFKLASGSSCINAGDNIYVTATTDLADTSRIIGSTVDLGCYESSFTTAQGVVGYTLMDDLKVVKTASGFGNSKIDGIRVNGNKIILPLTAIGKTIRVFNVNGIQIKNFVAEAPEITILDKGVYIVSINSDVYKVIL